MIQSFTIGCRLPGLNEMLDAAKIRKGAWSKYAEMKMVYGALCKDDIKRAKLTPYTGPVRIHFVWVEKNRKRDKDNVVAGQKFILDALVARQILTNDGWKQIASITHAWTVSKTPGVHVVIEDACE